MKQGLLLVLSLSPMAVHAGFESMLSPMMMPSSPMANPFLMAAPMAAPSLLGSPLGLAAPMAAPSLLGSPLGLVAPVAGMGAMYPAMQVAPNWMSFSHQAPQMLTNPYMGGPFASLPAIGGGYPFAPQIAPSPSSMSPFTQGNWFAAPSPAIPMNPYLMPPPSAKAATPALPFLPADWQRAVSAPQPVAAPMATPYGAPWLMPPAAPPAPAQPAPVQAQATMVPPFALPWMSTLPTVTAPATAAPSPTATPATVAATKPQTASAPTTSQAAPSASPAASPAALTPFDPAYWLTPLKATAPTAKPAQ